MKRLIFFIVIILSAASADVSAVTKKKTILVYAINTGINKKLDDTAVSNIKLTIINNSGPAYNITGIEDLKINFAQKEISRIITDTDGISAAAQMSHADEVICSKIIKESGGIKLNFTHANIDRNGKAAIKNNFTTDEFSAVQLEWYSIEAAKKIFKPAYIIKAPEKEDLYAKGLSFPALNLNPGTVLDSTVYLYETEDSFLTGILHDIRIKMKKGDAFFIKGDYTSAFKSYDSLLKQLKHDIPEQKRNEEIIMILDNVQSRIEESYYLQVFRTIRKMDTSVEQESALNPVQAAAFEKKYDQVRLQIPSSYTGSKTEELRKICSDRIDQLRVFNVRFYKAAALKCYETEEFSRAYSCYRDAADRAGLIQNDKLQLREKTLSSKDLETAKMTGMNYLAGRIYYLTDAAAKQQADRKSSAARKFMTKAEMLIKNNSEFLTPELRDHYNKTAMTVNVPQL